MAEVLHAEVSAFYDILKDSGEAALAMSFKLEISILLALIALVLTSAPMLQGISLGTLLN
jgi:hypothetical protein